MPPDNRFNRLAFPHKTIVAAIQQAPDGSDIRSSRYRPRPVWRDNKKLQCSGSVRRGPVPFSHEYDHREKTHGHVAPRAKRSDQRHFPDSSNTRARPDVFPMKSGSFPLFNQNAQTTADPGGAVAAQSYARRIHMLGQLAGIVTLIALWPQVAVPWQLLVWWVGTGIAQLILAGLACRVQLTHPAMPIHDPLLRHYLFSAIAVIGGGAWGSLALVGPYEAGPVAQAILFMALGGVTLTGAGILFGSRTAYAVFVTAVQLPLFIQTVVNPPSTLPHSSVFLGMFVLFALTLNDVLAISHRRLAATEPASRELPAPWQAMLDSAGEALILAKGLRIEHWNRRFSELMHVADQAPIRRLDACLANRREWHRHARAASDALGRGETYRSVIRLRRTDGSEFWAELSGRRVDGTPPAQIVWAANDISDRMGAETRASMAWDQLFALVGQSADWYWQTDSQHRLMRITLLAGPDKEGLEQHIGRKWWQFPIGAPGSRPAHGTLRHTFEQREAFRDLEVEIPDGSHVPRRHLHLSGTPRLDEHGGFLGYHGLATDVTERIRDRERIHFLAYHDPLTSLPNRRLLMERLEQSVARAHRYEERVGVILVDVDDFKRINDLAGHSTGDRILVEMADRLRHGVRACDTVARLEGDTFAVLLPELESAGAAEPVATKILSILHQPLVQPSPRSALGASLGIATYPDDAGNADGLLRAADARLLRAKRRGGQRIERA